MTIAKIEIKQTLLEFSDENVTSAYTHYEHVKNVLAGSNPGDAQKGAEMLNEALSKVEGSGVATSILMKMENGWKIIKTHSSSRNNKK